MSAEIKITRRTVLATPALLSLASAAAVAGATGDARAQGGSENLVAYFTRTGNTQVVVRQIRRATGADLFEITPVEPYPEDYDETVEQSRRERDAAFEPKLERLVATMSRYRTVYLGFPIWSGTAPPVIRSFLSAHDLSGKRLVPFITHGGYGIGKSRAALAEKAPGARLERGFSMKADQERQTLASVTDWLAASPR